jgi:hypothetical protein
MVRKGKLCDADAAGCRDAIRKRVNRVHIAIRDRGQRCIEIGGIFQFKSCRLTPKARPASPRRAPFALLAGMEGSSDDRHPRNRRRRLFEQGSRLPTSSGARKVTSVMSPPGRARPSTSPDCTELPLNPNTTGMLADTGFATRAATPAATKRGGQAAFPDPALGNARWRLPPHSSAVTPHAYAGRDGRERRPGAAQCRASVGGAPRSPSATMMRSQVSAPSVSPLRRMSSTISRALVVAWSPCCAW